jgi:tRNA pseudouridine38-40 synthase
MSQRYFAEIAYQGTAYVGWQKQPNQTSVQGVIEHALQTILNTSLEVVGCGRTDAGVHASYYVLHFDFAGSLPEGLLRRLNKFLPPDIVVYQITPVHAEAHARFDALEREYQYFLSFQKDPFRPKTAYHFPFGQDLQLDKLHQAAELIKGYQEFFPFCKSNSDAHTMQCQITKSHWETNPSGKEMIFYIGANRFLRGMVRLIVGMSLNVALGKITLESVRESLETQTRLERSWSAPADGLFLTRVTYEYLQPCTDF